MMKSYTIIIFIMLIMIPIIKIILSARHLLNMLLSLELLTLNTLMIIFSTISLSSQSVTINLMIILTLGATEAVLGLSCLVFMTRSFGSDNPSIISSFL